MKIGKVELTQERLVIALTAAIAITALAAYFIFYAPLMNKIKMLYQECKVAEDKVLQVRNVVESAGKYGDRVLVKEDEVAYVIDELTQYGTEKEIKIISIKPGEIEKAKDAQYKILPIEMKTESAYQQLGGFLGSLDGIEKTLIKVESFDIAAGAKDRTKVIADIALNIYIAGEFNE